MHLLSPGIREKCVDSLVFETMIPKPMMLHYISLLLKHKRLVLSGPSGTGKTHLAHRLARYLLERSRADTEVDQEPYVLSRSSAVTFNLHHQSQKVPPFPQSTSLSWSFKFHHVFIHFFFFYRSCSCIFPTWPTILTEKAEENCLWPLS